MIDIHWCGEAAPGITGTRAPGEAARYPPGNRLVSKVTTDRSPAAGWEA